MIAEWIDFYNTERPHSSFDGRTPAEAYGTTLIACEKAGRSARLVEMDPKYVDVIIKRWQEFTGKAATLESDGRIFDDVSDNRPDIAT